MRKTERRLALAVAPLVLLATYMGIGQPIGSTPIVVRTTLIGWQYQGRFLPYFPDFIVVQPDADATTIAHETLHYEHHDWTECQVSDTLAAQGMYDSYHLLGECNADH